MMPRDWPAPGEGASDDETDRVDGVSSDDADERLPGVGAVAGREKPAVRAVTGRN